MTVIIFRLEAGNKKYEIFLKSKSWGLLVP